MCFRLELHLGHVSLVSSSRELKSAIFISEKGLAKGSDEKKELDGIPFDGVADGSISMNHLEQMEQRTN